jgi:hypothetical protein
MYGLFDAIEKGIFPNLERIEIQFKGFAGIGSFRSCIDEGEVYQEVNRTTWRRAIRICTNAGVKLVSSSGEPIYLWADKHGIKYEANDSDPNSGLGGLSLEDAAEKSEEMILSGDSSSSSSEWTETEDEGAFQRSDAESDESLSDDSQDTPYRYVPPPDIERVDDERDSEISDLLS